jgi:hypothetical protein
VKTGERRKVEGETESRRFTFGFSPFFTFHPSLLTFTLEFEYLTT